MTVANNDSDNSAITRYPPAVEIERRADGEMILTCPYPPKKPARSMLTILQANALLYDNRPLLGERVSGQWRTLSYADAWTAVTRVAKTLADLGLGQSDNIAILSPKSFQHFQLSYGAQLAGVPVASVSTPYSLLSTGFEKLKHIIGLLRPSILCVENRQSYERALNSLEAAGLLNDVIVLETKTFDNWLAPVPTNEWIEAALDAIDHDTIARYVFTSGSTGMPKAVIYSQGMMVNNIAMHEGLIPGDGPPSNTGVKVLDWMPWSHTSAGVMRLNGFLTNGGTIYFDTGRPVAGEYHETLRNIREVVPTRITGAPIGYAMLADALEQDPELNKLVFSNIRNMGFGSAAMAPALFERLQVLSIKATGARMGVISSLASTEAIGVTMVYWPMDNPGIIGLPIPGVTLKLVPNGSKLELRVKGNTVTKGYYRNPEKNRESFDDEGFFKMGDAVRFADPAVPEKGLVFDGRVAEEFKLDTGTWVSAGTLRTQVVTATSPYLKDVVVCGLNQSFVTILAWPDIDVCARVLKLSPELSLEERIQTIVASEAVMDEIRQGLTKHNLQHSASSTRIVRCLLLAEPPSMDGNEVTEKGSINQRATQDRRAHLVEQLYAATPSTNVIQMV